MVGHDYQMTEMATMRFSMDTGWSVDQVDEGIVCQTGNPHYSFWPLSKINMPNYM